MTETKKVTGKTLSGDDREYTFVLLDAETGTRLFHEYTPLLVQFVPMATGGEEIRILEIARTLPDVLPWERLAELAKAFLGNGTVKINGKEHNMGANGFGDYCKSDPLEVYTALLYAIKANYPKYIDPLFEALEGQG